jgi:hypothetical protein
MVGAIAAGTMHADFRLCNYRLRVAAAAGMHR